MDVFYDLDDLEVIVDMQTLYPSDTYTGASVLRPSHFHGSPTGSQKIRTNERIFTIREPKKSISLVLTFKYYLKYKAQSEAKSLVSGLSITKNRELFPTPTPFWIWRCFRSNPAVTSTPHSGYSTRLRWRY